MAVIKAVSSKAGIGQALDYVTKEEKTEDKLVSGLHCEPDTVKDEMQATKELWGKTGGRTYKHFVHSYHEDEHITPEQAHKNAVELAKGTEAWKGHEVLIATHIDRGHIHTHFIVNSVNFEDGHKLQWSKNVKLNEADNVLKQNEELKKQNEKLKQDKLNAEQEAMTEVSAVKEECAKRERIAESKAQEADRLKSHLKAVEADLSGQIDKKAQNLVESKLNALHGVYEAKQRSLDRKFKAKTASYDSCMLGLLLYGVLTTVFTAVRSEAFVSDFKTFFKVVWGFLLTCFGWLENGANFMAQIGDKIPQEIVATIVHWLLWFIVLFGVGIGAVVLLLIGIAKLVKWYAEEYADNTSLGFALVSLALSIFFAEKIRAFLPINLLLLLILVHIVYVLIRWYVKGRKRARGYY